MTRKRVYNRRRSQINFENKSLTQQQFKEKQDINNILKKYKQTGLINTIQGGEALYGDFSKVTNFQDALLLVQNASDEFMQLPASVRSEFGNDPAKLLDFMDDEKNHDKARELGLLPAKKDEPKKPSAVPPKAEPAVDKTNTGGSSE